MTNQPLTTVEICAGGGGQALGLEQAGFEHRAAVELDADACKTLRLNRPHWHVVEGDLRGFSGLPYAGVDLLAGGVPCPPFSAAGKQLGRDDERDLFPEALRLVEELRPRAVMLENVRGLSGPKFASYRAEILKHLRGLGYPATWKVLNSSDFGLPQLRPRFILVAFREDLSGVFEWPTPTTRPPTVGATLGALMAAGGWPGAAAWAEGANDIAPTVVGGSKKHGGPDLGPTRARQQWAKLGVDGLGIAAGPPSPEFPLDGRPKLTVEMVARLQGFPADWRFHGKKTAAYRQVGNAFPPPVAQAIGSAVRRALLAEAPTQGVSGELPLLSFIQRAGRAASVPSEARSLQPH
jgi:DNA (cytosine-5)-methyltransferase 1